MSLTRLFWGDTPNHVRSISQSFSHVESCLSDDDDDEFFLQLDSKLNLESSPSFR